VDVSLALATLVSNSSTIERSLNNSNGLQKPDAIKVSEKDPDFVSVQIGTISYEAVELFGITGLLSPLPENLTSALICFLAGSSSAPIGLFLATPKYTKMPTDYGYLGTIIVGELLYYSAGSGFIPIAPYQHRHFEGSSTQSQDSGGDFQQEALVKEIKGTGWQLGYG
jgi:hypothetical protein